MPTLDPRQRYLIHRNRIWKILKACEKEIKQWYRLFSLTGIPYNDPTVVNDVVSSSSLRVLLPEYRQMQRYWEKDGFRGFLKALKPENLDDLAFANALYRPGPVAAGMAELFLNGQRGKVFHPYLTAILGPTKGAVLFHEQIIEIAKVLGFSTAQANALRVASNKRNEAVLAKYRDEFLRATRKKGIAAKIAEQLFQKILQQGTYSISRAWCYESMLCLYQLAYMERYFPAELRLAQRHVSRKSSERFTKKR